MTYKKLFIFFVELRHYQGGQRKKTTYKIEATHSNTAMKKAIDLLMKDHPGCERIASVTTQTESIPKDKAERKRVIKLRKEKERLKSTMVYNGDNECIGTKWDKLTQEEQKKYLV